MIGTRRQWLRAVTALPGCLTLHAARKEFWGSQGPASWTPNEKEALLNHSPWAQEGFARMETEPRHTAPNDGSNGMPSGGMPDTRPGPGSGSVRSVQTGDAPPPVPKADSHPVQFRVLARWESAKPVRLAGGPEIPELAGKFYVIRLRGLPLMPPQPVKPGAAAPSGNEGMLQALKEGSRLERRGKPGIPCAHLLTGTGDTATEVLLFFAQPADPVKLSDKLLTLESWFGLFHLTVKFPLKDMLYRGELAL